LFFCGVFNLFIMGGSMVIKIHRVVKKNGEPIAYTVKINGRKYPKGNSNFYFPKDRRKDSALAMAYDEYLHSEVSHES
jgi:hypothetical protein